MHTKTSRRRIGDLSIAFVTKLGWHLCTISDKIWVQLIRSKYMRGRRVLDFQQTIKSFSWIWADIRRCNESLWKRLCIEVGRNSSAHIQGDHGCLIWQIFLVPEEVCINEQVVRVRDLVSEDSSEWNFATVSTNFSPHISDVILNTPIIGEQDSFVWAPSKSGRFSIKSVYRINKERFAMASGIDRRLWKQLCYSSLHERHKMLIWKLLVDVLPTNHRIKSFVPLPDLFCFLCDSSIESISHFFV